MISKYVRGMVYWATIPITQYAPNVQVKKRPVIIVSNDVGNFFSQNITIIPCTSNSEKSYTQPTHCTTEIMKGITTVILCENIQTVDKSVLEEFIGILDDKTMLDISKALGVALGFTDLKLNNKPIRNIPEQTKEIIEEEPTPTTAPTLSQPPKKTENAVDRTIKSNEFMQRFLKEMKDNGARYVAKKYGLPSDSAAHQRALRYRKALDK